MSKIEFQPKKCYFRFFLVLSKRILLHYIAFHIDIYVLRVELLMLMLILCTVNEGGRYFLSYTQIYLDIVLDTYIRI